MANEATEYVCAPPRKRANEGSMPRFAANLGYLFTQHPLLARVYLSAAYCFRAIELQFPYDGPASLMKAAIARNHRVAVGINTPRGRDDEFGVAAMPGGERDF